MTSISASPAEPEGPIRPVDRGERKRFPPKQVRPIASTPLFFASAERPLYAVYHPPERHRVDPPVLIHCHTLGVEQVTSYRAEVRNAQAAARLGYPVLRFHARGHGDSAGDFADVTLASLVDDALAAAARARELSGSRRVAWLGVRFGALVAAEAVRAERDAAALVLWEPVHRPSDYFRSMLRGMLYSQVAQGKRPDASVEDLLAAIERDGRIDVHGYYLHRALFESVREADLSASLSAWNGPTLLCQVQARPRLWSPHAALAQALEGRGASVTVAQVHAEPGWHFVSNPPWLGDELVARTAEWLDALA